MKTYMTETALGIIAATLIGSAAFAFPAHQQDGFRDTGCDEDRRTAITNDAGDVLYWNNPTCQSVGGAGIDLAALSSVATAPAEEEDDEGDNGGGSEAPVDPEPETPCKSCAPVVK